MKAAINSRAMGKKTKIVTMVTTSEIVLTTKTSPLIAPRAAMPWVNINRKPLAISIALQAGANPAICALTVALATSNSFLIPTHQVNALIKGPGGYKVPDFMRAGIFMSIIFIVVMLAMMNLIF